MTPFEAFHQAYIIAALWSTDDGAGTPMDLNWDDEDLSPETARQMREDCEKFWIMNHPHILGELAPMAEYWDGATPEQRRAAMAGHDFWLTRCGHGAGFWDGDWPEAAGEWLTQQAEAFGNVDLYLGDDRQIHH